MTTIDKTSWPKIEALPSNVRAPAPTTTARFAATSRFLVGFEAAGASAPKYAVAHGDWAGYGDTIDARYAGRDPRAALAAAMQAAHELQVQPDFDPRSLPWVTGNNPVQTTIGLFQTRSGAFIISPLWSVPNRGTDRMDDYEPLTLSQLDSPEHRFEFRDRSLVAIVGAGGMIRNPAAAAAALLD